MNILPPAARVFVTGTVVVATVMVVAAFPIRIEHPWLLAALILLSCVSSALKVRLPLPRGESSVSPSCSVDFASLLLLGAPQTILVTTTGTWLQCVFRNEARPPLHRIMFSVAALVVTVCAAGQVHYLFGGRPGQVGTWSDLAALAGAATTYFAVNTLLVAIAVALSTRSPISQVWTRNFLWSAPGFFVAAGTATAVVLLLQSSSHWLIALAVVPMYLTYRSYAAYVGRIREEQQQVQRMADLHLATIEALAVAIDAKDQTNHMHIRRVQLYAASLAKSLGLPDTDIQGIRTAALLHDIGKLAVPEHILSKPGPLTPEEFQKIRAHPKTGADILAGVPFPYPVAPLILSHHERWDGKGYPQGLRGEEIPFGARILTVVDYFDALMAERPYHKAMPFEDAVALLRQDAGKALDPAIVDRFIDLLPELQAEAATLQTPHPALDLSAIHRAAPRATVFEDIALAHREIYALYEISQAMGKSLGVSDTMALITDKLSILVPFSTAALFLYDEQHDSLKCRYATGVDELLLQQLTVRNGDGLTGWVGRNRRALVNAQPSADLEAAGLPAGASELQSALICPLVLNERVIGTLGVYHVEPVFYREDHRRLLDRVAEQAAAAVRNSVLFEQTQQQSRTDSLTGLANNRSLIDRLDREMARAERLKSEVAMLLIDLDDFKDINDTYGHHVGDRALCEIADVLRTAIRPYDTCARYAGDEFIVLLSGCGMEDAEQKRQELQQLVGELVFEPVAGRRVQLAISAGAAVFPSDGHSYEALLSTADSRMYQDKSRRKRRSLVVRSKTPAPPVHGAASPDADDRGVGTAH